MALLPPVERDRPPPLLRDIGTGLLIFALYVVVASWQSNPGRMEAALANGRRLLDLDRAVGLRLESGLNSWLVSREVLRVLANHWYAWAYLVVTAAVLVWLYRRRPADYWWARRALLLATLLAVLIFAVYPVAPPRLLPHLGVLDTVQEDRTWGSWGSPVVENANTIAAMPSAHVMWAVWVAVVAGTLSRRRLVCAAGLTHVLVTVLVVTATANHYLLDSLAAAVVVLLSARLTRSAPGTVVQAADAFFLHVESPAAPQHVGGVAVLDTSAGTPTREALVDVVRAQLTALPRFRQRLESASRWRRPRWVDEPSLDWDWHVSVRDLTQEDGTPGGETALGSLVAELMATPLPQDRPMWRMVLVRGVGPGQAVMILVVHHAVSDGVGAVLQALNLFEPVGANAPAPSWSVSSVPTWRTRTTLGVVAGVAQLAADGWASYRLPAGNGPERRFGIVSVPLEETRALARQHDARVIDVLLAAVAGGLCRVRPDLANGQMGEVRAAVPLMVRDPGSTIVGNVTAGLMIDLPVGGVTELGRLEEVVRRSRRRITGPRVLASRFVMQQVGQVLPVPLHAWFARRVYGGRFFHAIVSNMPGPDRQFSLAGAPLQQVYPALPLAPGAPIALGALGWNGTLCLGITLDPALVDDADAFGDAVQAVLAELDGAGPTPGR